MAYIDPKTQQTYPSREWMMANIKNLPEVQKAYPATPPTVPGAGVATVGMLGQPQQQQFPNLSLTSKQDETLRIKTELDRIIGEVGKLTPILTRAETAGFGVETGKDIPQHIIEGKPAPEGVVEPPVPPEDPNETANKALMDRISKLETIAFATPTTDWQTIYKKAFEDSGLADVKTRMDDLDSQISQRRDELIQAEDQITKNPWLPEAGRTGRIAQLYSMAEKEITNLIDQRNSLSTEYQSGIERAERVATKTQAEQEAGRKLSTEELKYWQGVIEAREKIPETPKTFKTDEGTFAWEWDDETGTWSAKLISEAVAKEDELLSISEAEKLGVPYGTTKAEATEMGITPSKAPTVTETKQKSFSDMSSQLNNVVGTDGYVSPEDYKAAKKAWLDGGYSVYGDFDKLFARFINPTHRSDYTTSTTTSSGGSGEVSCEEDPTQFKCN